TPVFVDGVDVMPEIRAVREKIKFFTSRILSGEITGSSGKSFKHAVVIGIGGSCLGTEFVSTALQEVALNQIDLHYLSNVDIHNFGAIAEAIDPETTLWIVISKSFTTAETLANAAQARAFMQEQGLDPAKHFINVTGKGSPGDDPGASVIQSFHMFDFIGGRYSVTSAVGGVPLSLYLGYENFEEFLKGAEEMDIHAAAAIPQKNLPLLAALISVWNNNFLNYPAQAIIPYAAPLARLAAHIQQLNMESNGKYVDRRGEFLEKNSGVIIFGEPGTDAQHSFFQLAHQGRGFPIDFVGVVNSGYPQYQNQSKGVTNHQELWANLIAQPMALAKGKNDSGGAGYFPGNRPSSTIILNDLGPQNIGRLLSFYEARTTFEAFIWDINPFDQFGVELGKTMASDIRRHMAARNRDDDHYGKKLDISDEFYLDMLFSGKIPE
ncbi:MAG: glucose-6-phosphate isomerase, partial [Deltaproteobacteria bacterium]|nr:glucose-6-phosphate isomerase [Deltaproteobacteria bacterium]